CQSPDLAITGRDDNDVIARVKKRAGDDQVCLGSSNRHKHIRGCSACVQRGDALAQKAGSIDFRVVEREMGTAVASSPESKSLTLAHLTELSARLYSTVRSNCD